MAITLVQSTNISGANSGNYTSAITAGNSPFVVVTNFDTTSNPISTSAVTVSGQSLTKLMEVSTPFTTQQQYFSIWGAFNSPGGTSAVSATVTGGQLNPGDGLVVYEVAGLGSSWTVDQSVSNNSSTGTAVSSGSGTTTHSNEFVVGALAMANGATAGPSGMDAFIGIGGFTFNYGGESILTSTSTITVTATQTSGPWAAGFVSVYQTIPPAPYATHFSQGVAKVPFRAGPVKR